MHDDASGPKADALDLRLDQGSGLKGSVVPVCGPECIDDHGLDLGCRDPRDRSGLAPAALGEDRRDIVAIADTALLGRARGHRAICSPQVFIASGRLRRAITTVAASNRSLRVSVSPHFEMRPITLTSPD